jgi:MFS family permease
VSAGALFNPAVRAYVAAEAGERRVEAFALFNVFYQAGILLGPLIGLALTGVAFFLPPAATASTPEGSLWTFGPLAVSVALLTLGSVVVFPFEMDIVVTLAEDHAAATHYGLYNTICGVGIAAGNLLTGGALDLARTFGVPWAPWLALAAIGLATAFGMHLVSHADRLSTVRQISYRD